MELGKMAIHADRLLARRENTVNTIPTKKEAKRELSVPDVTDWVTNQRIAMLRQKFPVKGHGISCFQTRERGYLSGESVIAREPLTITYEQMGTL